MQLSYSLRFDPDQVPDLIAAFRNAADKLNTALMNLEAAGRLAEPWLGDEVSGRITTHFNRVAVDDPNSGLNVLWQYHDELKQILSRLEATSASYTGADSDATSRFTATS